MPPGGDITFLTPRLLTAIDNRRSLGSWSPLLERHTVHCVQPAAAVGPGGLPTGREELPTQNPFHLVRNPTEGIFPEPNRVFSQKT